MGPQGAPRVWLLHAAGGVVVLALVTGCTGGQAGSPLDEADEPAQGSSSGDAGEAAEPVGQEYEYSGTVIGDDEGARLCGGIVGQSRPPGCEGVEVHGWDWTEVPAETYSGVSWGNYTVVGTWDGQSLTVTRPVRPAQHSNSAPRKPPTTPCPVPAGGWVAPDPGRTNGTTKSKAVERAKTVPGYAGTFVERNPGYAKPTWYVLNIRTTGDVAAMETAVREEWGGSLCVIGGHAHSEAELSRVRDELFGSDLGVLGTGIDQAANAVDIMLWVAPPKLQTAMDERYGVGVVQLRGLLEPVD